MSYIDATLMKNEAVLYRTKPHAIIFSAAIIWLAITIVLFIFGPEIPYANYAPLHDIPLYAVLALITLFLFVITALSSVVNYQTSEYAITNKRVLMKIGFIRRMAVEIYLSKIESVKIYQTVGGRIFNYGSILISGVGGSKDPFHNIPAPLVFRHKVQEQIENEQAPKL